MDILTINGFFGTGVRTGLFELLNRSVFAGGGE